MARAGDPEPLVANPDLVRLGARVRVLREAISMTQQELADVAGLTRVTVSRLEAGLIDVRVTSLLGVARALEVGPGRLVE